MKEKVLLEVVDYIKLIVMVLVITTFLNTLIFTFSTVKQSSMEHTLMENDVLIIEKVSLLFAHPKAGDIVVFVEDEIVTNSYITKIRVLYEDMAAKLTGNSQRTRLVKRVIGVPGDVIDIVDGYVYVNDIQIDEPYIEDLTFAKVVDYPITVTENHYFVLGDNRDVSRDSRHFGLIDEDQIEGLAVVRVAPFSHLGMIH